MCDVYRMSLLISTYYFRHFALLPRKKKNSFTIVAKAAKQTIARISADHVLNAYLLEP